MPDLESIHRDLKELKTDFKEFLILMHGNGQIGFLARVQLLWESRNQRSSSWHKVLFMIIGAGISFVSMAAYAKLGF